MTYPPPTSPSTDLEMLVAFARTEHFGHTAAELGVSVATGAAGDPDAGAQARRPR